MAVFGSLRSPPGGGVTSHVLNFVQRVLNVGFEVVARSDVFLEERVSGEDGQQRLHVEIFAPGEEFEQADAVRRAVGPWGGMRWPIDQRPDGLFPFVVSV